MHEDHERYAPVKIPASRSGASEQAHLWLLLIVLVGGMTWYVRHQRAQAMTLATAATIGADGAPATPPPGAPHHYAPEGTFYMLQYVSVRTEHGMAGFEPGCEVHLKSVNQAKRVLVVSDGTHTVEVSPSMVTNDLDVANLARWQDEHGQQSLAANQSSK